MGEVISKQKVSVAVSGSIMNCLRKVSYMILPQAADDRTLVLSNPASLVSGYMAVNCSRDCVFSTDRERVLSGRFDSCVSPASDPAAACICGIDDDEWSAEFYLS